MKIILFENNNIENLYPITLTRSSFDILCGGTTLYQALKSEFPQASFEFKVRGYIQAYIDNKFGASKNDDQQDLFVDSSLVPDIKVIKELAKIVNKNEDFVVIFNGIKVAAYSSGSSVKNIDEVKGDKIDLDCKTFKNLWDVITINEEILASNLEYLKKGLREAKPGVFVGPGVKIEGHISFDTSQGPIMIGDETWVKPFSILRGPLFIGKKCIVNSFSELKHAACIGDVCKVGGEIEVSIFQGYSNKQHAGFLGSSYVGEWVNIGGGTSNSDLKNTYSTVKMQGQDTGKKFLGCIIGDYCKIALNVSIFTGKVIGVNSLLYGTITRDVPSFSNAGTLLKEWVSCPLELAHRIQTTMFERRKQKVTDLDLKLLTDVFEITKKDRKAVKVKEGKIEFVS